MSWVGRLLRLSYRLSRYHWSDLSAGAWLILLGSGVAILGLLLRRRLPWAVFGLAGLVLALGSASLLLWGRLSAYRVFRRHVVPFAPAGDPLREQEAIKARAFGKFFVEGKERVFADLQALYHTYPSREHAILAHVPRQRFLWLAQFPLCDVGMWYVFFRSTQIESVQAGTLAFGGWSRPALRILYRGDKRTEEVILTFENDSDRARVWADIQQDRPPTA